MAALSPDDMRHALALKVKDGDTQAEIARSGEPRPLIDQFVADNPGVFDASQVDGAVLAELCSFRTVGDVMRSSLVHQGNKQKLLDSARKASRLGTPRIWVTQGISKPLVHAKAGEKSRIQHPFSAISGRFLQFFVLPDEHGTGDSRRVVFEMMLHGSPETSSAPGLYALGSDRVPVRDGQRIVLFGLKRRADLNGREGVVVGGTGDHVAVRLDACEDPPAESVEIQVRPANLQALSSTSWGSYAEYSSFADAMRQAALSAAGDPAPPRGMPSHSATPAALAAAQAAQTPADIAADSTATDSTMPSLVLVNISAECKQISATVRRCEAEFISRPHAGELAVKNLQAMRADHSGSTSGVTLLHMQSLVHLVVSRELSPGRSDEKLKRRMEMQKEVLDAAWLAEPLCSAMRESKLTFYGGLTIKNPYIGRSDFNWQKPSDDVDLVVTVSQIHYGHFVQIPAFWALLMETRTALARRKLGLHKLCNNCGEKAASVCNACHVVFYCGRDCQTTHRPQHKKECRVYSAMRTAMQAAEEQQAAEQASLDEEVRQMRLDNSASVSAADFAAACAAFPEMIVPTP